MSKEVNGRKAEYDVNDLFLKRHSPRALSGEPIAKDEIMTLFEAACWAPSSFNEQPWRFIYAVRGTSEFETFFSFLVNYNKSWCVRASVLIVTISKKNFNYNNKENVNHSSDTGAAWENLALQTHMMGLVAHGMNGFDYGRAKTELGIPDDYQVEMMIAIGKHGNIEDLPEDMRADEKPNDRRPLNQIVFEGKFRG
ncbi:MAG TPA: nitroreductase family protein [Candidatus Paceibacterota bacterium]